VTINSIYYFFICHKKSTTLWIGEFGTKSICGTADECYFRCCV